MCGFESETILRSCVSLSFWVKHTSVICIHLLNIHSIEGESRVVMEFIPAATTGLLAHQLSAADLFVSAVNPKLVKDFNNDSLRKIKSDKADSVKIARYALDKWQNARPYSITDGRARKGHESSVPFLCESKKRLWKIILLASLLSLSKCKYLAGPTPAVMVCMMGLILSLHTGM